MLLIDTNVFLEMMLAQTKRDECSNFLNLVRAGKERATVTDFTIYSIMIILSESGRLKELKIFLRSLSAYRGLSLHTTSLKEKLEAVDLASERKFDIEDAIQYASARNLNVDGIVSLDTHFDNRDIPRIEPGTFATRAG